MRPATIEYPFLLTNDTITLDPDYDMRTDRTVAHRNVHPLPELKGFTIHGGMFITLKTMFDSTLRRLRVGVSGFNDVIITDGVAALDYAAHQGTNASGDCTNTWNEPTLKILGEARKLAFNAALQAATARVPLVDDLTDQPQLVYERSKTRDPSEYFQRVQVEQTSSKVVYRSRYLYLGIAVALTLLTNICVALNFAGWWSLGREVSLSPIELARAFAAPLLTTSTDSNATANILLKQAGDMKIAYGAVYSDGSDPLNSTATLKFDERSRCKKPQNGQEFARE